jgi:outer membrane protein TolC
MVVSVLAAAIALPGLAQTSGTTIPIWTKDRRPEPLPAGDRIELSLDRAIALALENALDLSVSSYTFEKASFGITGAEGAFDPYVQLDLSASRTENPVVSRIQASETKQQSANGYFGQTLGTGATYQVGWTNLRRDSPIPGYTLVNPTYSSSFGANITQPLLRNFGSAVNKRFIVQARITRDQSAWEFVRTVQNAIQLVDTAYWDLAFALENLKSKQEALDRARDLNRITKIKIDVGALAPIDIVQTEVTIAQREQDIITAEGLIGDAQDRLKRILNVSSVADWARPIVPTEKPSAQPYTLDVDAGLRLAFDTRPEVKQAVVDIESKKVSLVYNRNQLLPRLDLSGSYGLSGIGARSTIENPDGTTQQLDYVDALYSIRSREFPSWTVGLSLNMPIGNRTARANAALASTDLELSRTSLALLKQNLQLEVRSAARGVDTAYRSVQAAVKARELAERNLDAERKKFENGMSTSFTVAQIQNDLTTARTQELLTIASYQKSITGWHTAIGDILPSRGITINGLPVTLEPTPAQEGGVMISRTAGTSPK